MGLPVVLLSPLLFVPLLGYAVEATRAAQQDPTQGPPPWRFNDRMIRDGGLMFWAIALTWIPFALLDSPVAAAIRSTHLLPTWDVGFQRVVSGVIASLVTLLPAGLVALLWLPHATARFATTGRARDLFDVGAVIRGVRRDFATWNLVTAAIVTGWAIGLACASLLCVGLVPGVYYAILVSAHASATLQTDGDKKDRTAGQARDSSAR